jgi:hypothetical protein
MAGKARCRAKARREWRNCSALKIAGYEPNPPQQWFTMIRAVKIGAPKIRRLCGNGATMLQSVMIIKIFAQLHAF